jgi:hypothetical protein
MANPQAPSVTAPRVMRHAPHAMSTQEILSRIHAMYADRDDSGEGDADHRGPDPR